MTVSLRNLIAAVEREAAINASFRADLLAALRADAAAAGVDENSSIPRTTKPVGHVGRAKNRRARAVLDPYELLRQGDANLRSQLQTLSLDQLKDVVSEHSIDSSRLALKWRSRERLMELIVSTVRNRIEKGDAFRIENPAAR